MAPTPQIRPPSPYSFEADNGNISLHLNEFRFAHSPQVVSGLQDFIAAPHSLSQYNRSEDLNFDLANAYSSYLGTRPENLMIVNGADTAIDLLLHVYGKVGSVCIVQHPSYIQYKRFADARGLDVVSLCEWTIASIESAISAKNACVVFIGDPNNPDGKALEHGPPLDSLFSAHQDVLFVLDQTYADYRELADGLYPDQKYIPIHENVACIRSFSKVFGLADLRVAHIVSHPNAIQDVSKYYNHKNVPGLCKTAALLVLRNIDWYSDRAKEMHTQRKALVEHFGANAVDTDCNFITVQMPDVDAAEYVANLATNHGINVRNVSASGCGVRISVGTPDENRRLCEADIKMPPVYCINLSSRPDRRLLADGEFARENLKVEFYTPDADPRGGEIGCWLSHKACYTKFIAESTDDFCIVFEDDVELTPDFRAGLNHALAFARREQWDIIRLGGLLFSVEKRRNDHIVEARSNNCHAYLIHRDFVKKCLADARFDPLSCPIGIDDYFRVQQSRDYAVYPSVVYQRGGLGTDNTWYALDALRFQSIFQSRTLYGFLQRQTNLVAYTLRFLPQHVQPFLNPVPLAIMANSALNQFAHKATSWWRSAMPTRHPMRL